MTFRGWKMSEIISVTESVCPECLNRISAMRVQYGEDVYLEKECPAHGHFKTIIWRGTPAFSGWVRPKTPTYPENPFTEVRLGCPFDCGLCPEHEQQSCCVLLEVTQRCDLHCPVCFADAAHTPKKSVQGASNPPPDLTHDEIRAWYQRLLEAGGPFNIQLSGGEPCVRDDLPEIIRIGRSYGFTFFQLNTNGLRIARDVAYLTELKEAGLSTVFLQFDGTEDAIYRKIRGRNLLEKKITVIENCARLDIGVVLVPTLVPSVNTDNIGNILKLALAHMPVVRGVHFQPVSYFGRYPEAPTDEMRITIPEVIRAIETQTEGLIPVSTLCPPGGENALCSFHGNYVLMPDGALKPLTRHKGEACCQPVPAAEGAIRSREFVAEHWASPAPPRAGTGTNSLTDLPVFNGSSFGEWDVFLERKRTHTFCVSGMAFQDAWTLDLERLRDCYIHTASPDGRLVPFCAYNLTNREGQALYRGVTSKVEGQKSLAETGD
jgi:7,8-dihydro-6-hydroxymethylpterin dimethyltransferase